jgi:dTDP-4-dehydrorhamnose reductase
MTRYLVTGAQGMLGGRIVQALEGRHTVALTREDLDITSRDQVFEATAGADIIINAAAYTDVDDAEINPERAMAVNARGPENLALAASRSGAVFLHVSTDYVFDGLGHEPYREDAVPNPLSAYGRSKAVGESMARAAHPQATVIVRSAWVYDTLGRNFATTILDRAAREEPLAVVDDQRGQPTWAVDLADAIVRALDHGVTRGVLHATSTGQASWFDFAQALLAARGLDPDLISRLSSDQLPRRAPRPAYSVLGHARWRDLGLSPIRHWREGALAAFSEAKFSTQ